MTANTLFYKTQNISQHFLFNQDKIKMEPKVYEDIHNYWSELQGVEITKVDTILNPVIWNNQFITIQKMPFRWENGSNWISCILKIFYQIIVTF